MAADRASCDVDSADRVIEGLKGVVGQRKAVEELKVIISLAKLRNDSLGHIMITGSSQEKRTEIANAIVFEAGSYSVIVNATTITNPKEMFSILNNLKDNEILIIDRFEKLRPLVKDVIIDACVKHSVSFLVGKGMSARPVNIDLPQFTMIALIDEISKVSDQCKSMVEYIIELNAFDYEECKAEIKKYLFKNSLTMTDSIIERLAKESLGIVEIRQYLSRIRDWAQINQVCDITDELLDSMENREHYDGILGVSAEISGTNSQLDLDSDYFSFRDKFVEMAKDHVNALSSHNVLCALLKDYFPGETVKIYLILLLYDLNIKSDLEMAKDKNIIYHKYERKRFEEYGVRMNLAKWAVDVWVYYDLELGKR